MLSDIESNMNFMCIDCNKTYANKNCMLNHQRMTHQIKKYKQEITSYPCKFCDKTYAYPQSRWAHQKKCELKYGGQIMVVNEIDKIKIENQNLLKDNIEKSEQIIKLQNKLLTCKRLDKKTFKAVNQILIDRSLRNSNSNNTVINNTYQICPLGNENLANILTTQQKKQILNSRLCSLEKIIEIAHCGGFNQFKNIIVTNLKDNYAYKYDETVGYFVTVNKTHLLDDVVSHRVTDIEAIYDELQTANKIDDKTKKLIQDFLDRMDNNDVPFYDNETKYENFKTFKTDKIKILLYNNQDKITKDIALLISDV